jgi:hypothetical protein
MPRSTFAAAVHIVARLRFCQFTSKNKTGSHLIDKEDRENVNAMTLID